MGLEMTLIDKELGYELRCADPIPFDAEYTRDLGYGAVQFLMSDESAKYGAVISLEGGRLRPVRFEDMINPETHRMKPRKVDVDGESYRCARAYMIRLESRDVADPARLGRLAKGRQHGMPEPSSGSGSRRWPATRVRAGLELCSDKL